MEAEMTHPVLRRWLLHEALFVVVTLGGFLALWWVAGKVVE